MASIKKHISDLLCLHDCVIVPGMGGFVANHRPAVIIDERNLFLPPSKEIGFNRSLSHNDGLLANHICKQEALTWGESITLLEEFVSDIQTRINTGETILFDGIGNFRVDALGNLQFTPNERNHLVPGSFGLDEFHFEPLEHPVLSRKHEEPARRLLRSRSPHYWAAVAAMMAGLFFFSPELKMPEHQQVDTGNIISTISQSEKTVAEDNSKNPTPAQFSDAEKTTNASSSPKADPVVAQTNYASFHLIAGSFKYEAPAQEVINQMKQDGFSSAKLLHSTSGRYRISVISFPDRSEAIEKLFALRKQEKFKNIWLLSDNRR